MRLVLTLWLILTGGQAFAETYLERLKAAVAAPPAKLDAHVADAHEDAIAAGELEDFWVSFDLAFGVTRPQTQRALKAWLETTPESAYAMAAMATALRHRAFLYRGGYYARDVPPENMRMFLADRARAADLAWRAIDADERMVWAYFALFNVDMPGTRARFDQMIRVFPEPRAINAAMGVYHPLWGGSVEEMLTVCERYGWRIPDYDRESCEIYALIINAPRDRRAPAASNALWQRDDPWLERLKFHDFYENAVFSFSDTEARDWGLTVIANA